MRAHRYLGLIWLLLSASATAFAQAPANPSSNQAAKEETCTVSGMVVRKEDNLPLKGAVIRLSSPEDQDQERTIAVKSKADGRFELKNVPASKYHLSVNRNGYFGIEYGQNKPSDPGATFTLVAGQRMTDLVFKMGRAGVIAGHVVDEDGDPMPEVAVIALRTQYEKGHKELMPRAFSRTNDLGEFRLHGLPPGRYYLSAESQNWTHVVGDREFSGEDKTVAEKAYTKTYYPGYSDPAKGTAVTVKEGEEIPGVDFLMKEVNVYRIRGKVIDQATKGGMRNGMIEVRPRNQRNYWMSYGSHNMLKPGGSFDIAEVPPGEYTVVARLFDEGKSYMTQQDVDVVGGDVDGLTLVIGPGVAIPGKIIWDGQPSLSKDELRVGVESEGVEFWGGDSRVEENNQFTLKDIPEGAFRVHVTGLGKDCYLKEVRYGDSTSPDTQFRVGKGSSGNLEITISSRGARVEGMVLTADNLPAAGVWGVAVPEESKRQYARLYKAERTDQNGAFSLHGLAPGKYKLFSWTNIEEGAWEDEDFLKAFEDKGETVEVQDGDARALELKLISSKDSSAKPE